MGSRIPEFVSLDGVMAGRAAARIRAKPGDVRDRSRSRGRQFKLDEDLRSKRFCWASTTRDSPQRGHPWKTNSGQVQTQWPKVRPSLHLETAEWITQRAERRRVEEVSKLKQGKGRGHRRHGSAGSRRPLIEQDSSTS